MPRPDGWSPALRGMGHAVCSRERKRSREVEGGRRTRRGGLRPVSVLSVGRLLALYPPSRERPPAPVSPSWWLRLRGPVLQDGYSSVFDYSCVSGKLSSLLL